MKEGMVFVPNQQQRKSLQYQKHHHHQDHFLSNQLTQSHQSSDIGNGQRSPTGAAASQLSIRTSQMAKIAVKIFDNKSASKQRTMLSFVSPMCPVGWVGFAREERSVAIHSQSLDATHITRKWCAFDLLFTLPISAVCSGDVCTPTRWCVRTCVRACVSCFRLPFWRVDIRFSVDAVAI